MDNNTFIKTNELEEILFAILKKEYKNANNLAVRHRVVNDYSSTFPSEIVTCELWPGAKLKLFCKYINSDGRQNNCDQRGGIEYEPLVYKTLLKSMEIKFPKFYGAYFDHTKTNLVLVLEYLENTLRVDKVPSSILDATKWIAEFHKKSRDKINNTKFSFLKKYDFEYYSKWPNRALELTPNSIKQKFEWLPQLCENYKSNLHLLLDDKQLIIHGEYYPLNVLVYKRQIVPIDWESVAVASGVVDLASLTEGWEKDTVEDCVLEYCNQMDEKINENKFLKRFWLAQLHWHFRGIGKWVEEIRETTPLKPIIRFYKNMFELGSKLELM